MEIRILTNADAQVWWNIRLEALETEPFAFGRTAEEHRAISVEAIGVRFRDRSAESFTMGAFEGTKLIGIASYLRESSPKEKHKGGIYGVYVAQAYRRKGAGRALISALVEKAKEDETLEQILIAVATHQTAARNLYRSIGFQAWGVEPRALKIGSEYVDEEHMLLLINPETAA